MIKRVWWLVKLLVSLSLVGWLVWDLDWGATWLMLSNLNWFWFGVSLGLSVLFMAITTWRWQILVSGMVGEPVGFDGLWKATLRSRLVGLVLPSGVGGDLARPFMVGDLEVSKGDLVRSVLVDKGFGLVGVLVVGLGMFWYVWSRSWVWVGFFVTVLMGVLLLAKRFGFGWIGLVWPRALGLSLVSQLVAVLSVAAMGEAVGLGIPLRWYLVVVPVSQVASALPISIGGLGVREVVFAGMLGMPEEVLGLSLMLYLVQILVALVGWGVVSSSSSRT